MSTFLELCQAVARESGTVPIGQPETVSSQTGRLLRIVNWVDEAYRIIQRSEADWRWLRANFSYQTIANVSVYDAESLNITERFSRWVYQSESGDNLFSIYLTSEGQSDEGLLQYVEYNTFRREFLVGSAATQTGKPIYITINDSNHLVLYPTPNAAYTLRGRYRKFHQTLSADDDIPEMPAEFHDAIRYRALMLMATFDESFAQNPMWAGEYAEIMDRLRQHQLPRVSLPEPLA